MQFRKFLLFGLLFLVLVSPSIAVMYYSYSSLHEELTRETYTRRHELARLMGSTVEARLDAVQGVAVTTAGNIAGLVEKGDWEAAAGEVGYVSKEFPYIDRIFLTDTKGFARGFYPSSPENIGGDFSFRDWYKGISRNWETYVSEVFKRAPVPQFNTVAVVTPIKDKDGLPIGILGFAINLNSFYALTEDFTVDKGGFLYIVNHKGQIVAHPKYDAQGPIVDYKSVPVVQRILARKSGVEILHNPIEKEDRLAAYQVIPGYNWGVIIADPLETAFVERDATLQTSLRVNAVILLINVVLAIAVLLIFQKLRNSRAAVEADKMRDDAILENIGDGLIITDAQSTIILANPSACELLKLPKEKVIGSRLTEIVSMLDKKGLPIPSEQRPIFKSRDERKKISGQYSYKRQDGTTLPISATTTPLILKDKVIGMIVVYRDVSHERELERMKDEFVSIASHELRTPMTAIRGLTSMILEGDYGPLSPTLTEPLRDIDSSTQRLIRLVNDMLNVARIEAGRMKFTITQFDIEPLMQESVGILQIIAKQKNIQLLKNTAGSMTVQGDVDKVKQVLNNLVGNALKFTDHGSITIRSVAQKDHVTVFIEDSGIGISEEDQKKLFGKFQQATSEQGRPAGTGLGLFISKGLMQKMGGDVWIERSVPGHGSVFAFSVPLAGSEAAKKASEALVAEAQAHADQVAMT